MAPKSSTLNQTQVDGNKINDDNGSVAGKTAGSDSDINNKTGINDGEQQVAGKLSDSSRGSPTREPLRKLLSGGSSVASQEYVHKTHTEHHTKHFLLEHEHLRSSPIDPEKKSNKDHLHQKEEEAKDTSSESQHHVKHQREANKEHTRSQKSHDEYNVRPIAQPLVIAEHHHRRTPIGGQMNDSRERIELLRAQGELTSYPIEVSYSERLVGYAFLLGLPLLACFTIMLLILLIFKNCRRFGQQEGKNYGSGAKSKSGKQRSRTSDNFEKQPAGGIGFISGGKVISSLKGINIIGAGGKEKSDSKQLTLNMEGTNEDCESSSGGRMKLFNAGNQKIKYYGKLSYRMCYNFNESILSVTILRAEKLPAMDLNGYSDPYVKVYLTPEKRNYYKTRIHRKSLNPTFDETFQFRIAYATLMSQTLIMAVYDYDRFSKHDEIGQVAVPISSIDLAQTYENWSELKRIIDSDNGQVSRRRG